MFVGRFIVVHRFVHEPNKREEIVNPLYLRENSDLDEGQVEYALRNLKNAGWVGQLNRGGLYELVDDPRED